MTLTGKVVLITGGSRGMGREMAVAFARAGASGVLVTAAPGTDETEFEIAGELDGVVAEIERAGSKGIALEADVTVWVDCVAAVDRTVKAFGALHVLVNNAGKSQRYHGPRDVPFWKTDHNGWKSVIDTNVIGPYLMAKAAVPHLLAAGWGRIINISKHPDQMHVANAGAYGPSKACLEAQSLSWAEELLEHNVMVNCLDPGGAVNTKFGRGTIRGVGLAPEVIVPAALWLASEASNGVTGCRFDAKRWDPALAPAAAGERCREGPLFPIPTERQSPLERAWEPPSFR